MELKLPIQAILDRDDNELLGLMNFCKRIDTFIYKYLSGSFKVFGFIDFYAHCIDYLKEFETDKYILNPILISGYEEIKDKEFHTDVNNNWYSETFDIFGNVLLISNIISKLHSLKENSSLKEDFSSSAEYIEIAFVLNEVYVTKRYYN